jgi:hypothetical protein
MDNTVHRISCHHPSIFWRIVITKEVIKEQPTPTNLSATARRVLQCTRSQYPSCNFKESFSAVLTVQSLRHSNWATIHPYSAKLHLAELQCTLMSWSIIYEKKSLGKLFCTAVSILLTIWHKFWPPGVSGKCDVTDTSNRKGIKVYRVLEFLYSHMIWSLREMAQKI